MANLSHINHNIERKIWLKNLYILILGYELCTLTGLMHNIFAEIFFMKLMNACNVLLLKNAGRQFDNQWV